MSKWPDRPCVPRQQGADIDPEVLSTLPPSMQFDVMLKMREQQMAVNREAFVQRAAVPQDFSQFQLQTYLKATALRRKMDDIKDAMNAAASGAAHGLQVGASCGAPTAAAVLCWLGGAQGTMYHSRERMSMDPSHAGGDGA